MRERLARINTCGIHALTVYASDGDMVAFKYDSGGYGWANRKTFVGIEEAERLHAEAKERQERIRVDQNLAARLRIYREIERVERDLARLNDMLARYESEAPHA